MKNVFKAAGLAVIVSVAACKNVDPALVQEMQQTSTTLQAAKPAADAAAQSVADLKNRISAAAATAPSEGATFINEKVTEKYNNLLNQYQSAQAELKQLNDDYNAGKLKTEEASVRFTELKQRMDDFEQGFKSIAEVASRPAEDMIKIGEAQMKSAREAAGMPANVAPAAPSDADVAGGRAIAPAETKQADAQAAERAAGATITTGGKRKQ